MQEPSMDAGHVISVVDIQGMYCQNCVQKIELALAAHNGVLSVKVILLCREPIIYIGLIITSIRAIDNDRMIANSTGETFAAGLIVIGINTVCCFFVMLL